MPTPTLSLNSPYHLLFKTEPNYQKLKIFGCLCFPWLRPYRSHKLETRSTQCVFLGYSLTQSAYLCFEPLSKRLYVSRHVRFVESNFPFLSLMNSQLSPHTSNQSWFPPVSVVPTSTPSSTSQPPQPTSSDQTPSPLSSSPTSPAQTETPANETQSVTNPITQVQQTFQNPETTNQTSQAQQNVPNPETIHQAQNQTSNNPSPQTQTSLSPPTNVDQTSPLSLQPDPQPNQHPMTTRAKRGISKPNSKYAYAANLTQSHHFIPTTIAQALADQIGDKLSSMSSTQLSRTERFLSFHHLRTKTQWAVVGFLQLNLTQMVLFAGIKLVSSHVVTLSYQGWITLRRSVP